MFILIFMYIRTQMPCPDPRKPLFNLLTMSPVFRHGPQNEYPEGVGRQPTALRRCITSLSPQISDLRRWRAAFCDASGHGSGASLHLHRPSPPEGRQGDWTSSRTPLDWVTAMRWRGHGERRPPNRGGRGGLEGGGVCLKSHWKGKPPS